MAANPTYYRDDSNYGTIREYLDDHDLEFNRENLATHTELYQGRASYRSIQTLQDR